jgi:MarR family transcriptional regulator for hemolysin
MRPARIPIGLQLAQAARTASRAFDEALAGAGGSLPVWLVLLSLKTRSLSSQRELAEAVGIREATLTHHLTAMESAGLVSRRRDAANRRIQVVELTPAGEDAFGRLGTVAMSFDRDLRRGVTEAEIEVLGDLLGRVAANAAAASSAAAGGAGTGSVPWAGLAETTS